MANPSRKRWGTILRIGVCAAALWFVIQGVTLHDHIVLKDGGGELKGVVEEQHDQIVIQLAGGEERVLERSAIAVDADGAHRISYGLKSAWRDSVKYFLLLALAMHSVVVFFQAVRLRWLLGAQDIRVGYWDCLKLSFAGNFLNFATPLGSNAGDVFKAYFVTTHTTHKTEAATTIALDRAIGLGTLISCVALIAALSPTDSRLAAFRPYMLTALGLGVVGLLAYLSSTLRRYIFQRRWFQRLPLLEQLRRIDNTAQALIHRKAILAGAVLVTVALQVCAIGAYFAVAVALTLDAHAGNALEYYAYFYMGSVIQALPGPPQGLGTVELAYRYFFAPFGSPSQIVCMAFAIRVMVLACALPGLLVTLTGSYKPSKANAAPADSFTPTDTEPTTPPHDLASV